MISDQDRDLLVQKAVDARENAYAPYSNYQVGAALLTKSGVIYTGVNVENAAYSVTMCAERTAVFKAVSEGEKDFSAIAIATDNAGFSCGSCRQVLAEFGPDTLVLVINGDGQVVEEVTVADLLPKSFSPADLNFPETI